MHFFLAYMFSLLSNLSADSGDGTQKIEFSAEQFEEMAMMYRYGFSVPEIAEWFSVDDNTIYRRLRGMDVKIRRPGGYIERDVPSPWTGINAVYVFDVLIEDVSIGFQDGLSKSCCPKEIGFATPDEELVTTFSDAVESAFRIQTKTRLRKRNQIVVRAYSVDLAESYNRFKWRTETWRVPAPFFDAPEDIKVALCQGKLDPDGGVQGKAAVIVPIHEKGLKDLQKVVESLDYKTTLNGDKVSIKSVDLASFLS